MLTAFISQDLKNTEMHTSTKISLQTSSSRERSKHEIQSLVRITTVHSGPLSIYTEKREKKTEVRGKRWEKSVPIFTVLGMHGSSWRLPAGLPGSSVFVFATILLLAAIMIIVPSRFLLPSLHLSTISLTILTAPSLPVASSSYFSPLPHTAPSAGRLPYHYYSCQKIDPDFLLSTEFLFFQILKTRLP